MFSCALTLQCFTSDSSAWGGSPHEFLTRITCYDWFCKHSASTVRDTMLSPIREAAGLGSPPSPYYTNAIEGLNKVTKDHTNYKKKELPEFVLRMKNMIDMQFAEVERALAGIGEFRVSDDCQAFQYEAREWCKKNDKQRAQIIYKFNKFNPYESSQLEEYSSCEEQVPLSSTENPLQALNLPAYLTSSIWEKSGDILKASSAMLPAPCCSTCSEAWMVASNSGKRPHYVQKKGDAYFCDAECVTWSASKICAHVVAVSRNCHDIQKLVAWYQKSGQTINMTKLAKTGVPRGVGKKPSKRKGVSKAQSKRIQQQVDTASTSDWTTRFQQTAESPLASTQSQQILQSSQTPVMPQVGPSPPVSINQQAQSSQTPVMPQVLLSPPAPTNQQVQSSQTPVMPQVGPSPPVSINLHSPPLMPTAGQYIQSP